MSTTLPTRAATTPAGSPMLLPPPVRWHGPLIALAIGMVVLGVVATIGLLVDQRELVGAPVWAKPLKFAISIAIYAVTWAWLIGQLTRFRRTAWWAGTVIAATLAIETVLMVLQTVRGHRSHFNQANPFDEAVWSIMGTSIAVLWIATLVAAVLLWFTPLADRARSLAIRLGAALCLVGLGLGFLMTMPLPAQLDDYEGIIGAHTVGADDGGSGLLLLGWSTEHGDLRIPHFIGMHALQVLPLALLLIELAARRVAVLADVRVRVGLVWTTFAIYGAVMALVTWQALRGQSIMLPDAATLLGGAAIVGVALIGIGLSLRQGAAARR
ncbi:hypothetical protein WJX64_06275 [Leifsonia sp. YIM 134122]|uniref:Uncharacterized protein n=1 Tax=Leifsonia stereocauli TaxID=3134136 RepID=A0ABU9W2B4_9MICO